MSSKEDVMQAALKLLEHERLELAQRLYESVEASVDPDAEEAWAKEIERRISAADSGKTKAVPWKEARRQMTEGDNGRQVP